MSFYCEVKLMWQLIEAMAVQMERFCSVKVWKKGIKDAPTPVCCTPNSHVTDHGGSPGSALVLGSAAWEVQPLGSERVQLLQCLTGSLNFLGKMPQGGLQHWHVIWVGDKHAAQRNCRAVGSG